MELILHVIHLCKITQREYTNKISLKKGYWEGSKGWLKGETWKTLKGKKKTGKMIPHKQNWEEGNNGIVKTE